MEKQTTSLHHQLLKELIVLVDEALVQAEKQNLQDAVNWARVNCQDAEICISSNTDVIYRAWISNASPDASELQRYVREYLYGKHDLKVQVHTEW